MLKITLTLTLTLTYRPTRPPMFDRLQRRNNSHSNIICKDRRCNGWRVGHAGLSTADPLTGAIWAIRGLDWPLSPYSVGDRLSKLGDSSLF